ncbi:hypothetical protein [Herbaspirillum huttiense]|uniref:hypothetical protein n=1 Tax=Herbaspirillum huttiense TaxID=863372 RepID=UPI0003F67C30|nr:hypothetical protein [Herbaspirillum huttiense]MBN9359780.1 hypothetical protein [Herbaspirillum huttiense]
MRRALDWLVVDASGRVAGVDQAWLPLSPQAGMVAEKPEAANDASVLDCSRTAVSDYAS